MREHRRFHRIDAFQKIPGFVSRRGASIVWILLLLPFAGLLWLPFYNHEGPALFGFPFFYWYQLLWVPVTALLIWIAYRHGKKNGIE